jgi:hypothetical protein
MALVAVVDRHGRERAAIGTAGTEAGHAYSVFS